MVAAAVSYVHYFSLIIDFIEYLSSADVMLRYDSEVRVILITEINSFLKIKLRGNFGIV